VCQADEAALIQIPGLQLLYLLVFKPLSDCNAECRTLYLFVFGIVCQSSGSSQWSYKIRCLEVQLLDASSVAYWPLGGRWLNEEIII